MSGWTEADALVAKAETALRRYLQSGDGLQLEPKLRDELILRTTEIVAAWQNNREKGPKLETQRDNWPRVKKHARDLLKSLERLSRDLGDDFDDILSGGIAEPDSGAEFIAQLLHIEQRADRLVKNFSRKAVEKRPDKFLVMGASEAWAIATDKRPTANQEHSPFFKFLLAVYKAYDLDGPPSITTLQGWLPKQT